MNRRLIARLWEYPTQLESATWLRDLEYCSRRNHDSPSGLASIDLLEFRSYAQASVGDKEALTDLDCSVLYRILIALGSFPFPPDLDARFSWDSLVLSTGMLRESGQHAMSTPDYALPRPENDEDYRIRERSRGSREQLRLIFQALATVPPDHVLSYGGCSETATLDPNEDLLDALAVGMNLSHDLKLVYFVKDFQDVMSVLPCSESNRKLLDHVLDGSRSLVEAYESCHAARRCQGRHQAS